MPAGQDERARSALSDPRFLLAETRLSEAGGHPVSRDRQNIGMRPFPFPFVAGIALADAGPDADPAAFEEARCFISGTASTPYGNGLGLEIGVGLSANDAPEPFRTHRRELAREGWLDSVSFATLPDRVAAGGTDAVLKRLDGSGATPSVFLPVGPSPGPEMLKALGSIGVRYRATPDLLEADVFGAHLDYRKDELLQDAIARYDWEQWAGSSWHLPGPGPVRRHFARRLAKGTHALTSFLARWGGESGEGAGPQEGRPFDSVRDRLLVRFNHVFQEPPTIGMPRPFKRYRGPFVPSLTTLPLQLRTSQLDGLETGGGAVVVEVRLGLWSLIGRASGRDSIRPVGGPALDSHALSALRDLARRRDQGRLLVATTGRLLDLVARRERLRFSLARSRTRWVVTLDGVDEDRNRRRPVHAADLNGLAFLVPPSAPEVVVQVAGRAGALPFTRSPDPAHRGLEALHAPWTPLDWPVP